MNCPICNAPVKAGSKRCRACGADLSDADAPRAGEFIFCEGCGARLRAGDRSCPKCGRPAPGILSERSSASDLAAGKTASFPRISSDVIAGSVPVPPMSGGESRAPLDADSTSALAADALFPPGPRAPLPDPVPPARRPARRMIRWVAIAAACALVAGCVWFAVLDPFGVMPGLYRSLEDAASEMFPSREAPEGDGGAPRDPSGGEGESGGGKPGGVEGGQPEVSDSTLSEAEVFQRLSAIYGQIVSLQDDIGPVVETYNGQYLVKDREKRQAASRGAYDLRDAIGRTIAELDSLELADDSAYREDVDHLRQLATWTFNRVDVLCRSWDVNLALPEGEIPVNHKDEILAPLRGVEMIDGKAVDVVMYERNVAAWKPVEK